MEATSQMAGVILYQRCLRPEKEKKQRVWEPPKGAQMFVSSYSGADQ